MNDLRLGPDVIEKLIPHRRPFLMVDGVLAYERSATPSLRASRHVSANEPVFEGHFPGLHLWPGVYTIEGMGQTSNLLLVIDALVDAWGARGLGMEDALEALRNLERGYKLSPGYDAAARDAFVASLGADPLKRAGMSAAVDVKLLHPAFAGQRIDYEVRLTHKVDRIARFEVHAEVEGRPIAKGVMRGTVDVPAPGRA